MRALVLLADRAERSPAWRETRFAVADAGRWGWLVALVAAVAVWVARGMPSPSTAGAAAAGMLLGAALAALRTWRRAGRTRVQDDDERRAAASSAARLWLTLYGTAGALVPAAVAAVDSQRDGALLPLAAAAAALVVLAVLTMPLRARARLLARLRVGAAAVAGGDDVDVGRALWSGWSARLTRVYITYPRDWAAHRVSKRDDLVERVVYDLCGPPPRTPAEAIRRPDYATAFNHTLDRLEVERVPSLPRRLAARDWGEADGIVLGQTTADQADAVLDGVPVALYRPANHLLLVGATQHGKSSGARAWAVDALNRDVFPGGLWGVDGKGSGSLAPLIGREGVHAVAHAPDEWRHVLVDLVAPEVRRRYEQTLAWRSGRLDRRPWHPRALLILDEIQQVLMACPDLGGVLDTLARQALEANVILWVLTQRPDAKDAVPGAVRDQLVDRATFGPLSGAGAKMAFDVAGDEWHRALGVAPVRGRALTWMGGRWRPVQAPWLAFPADVPAVEPLYPPYADGERPRPAPRPRPAARPEPAEPTGGRAAEPRPVPPPPRPAEPPRPAPVPEVVEEILRDFGDPAAESAGESAAYDPGDPYAHRRRRRRRD